MTRDYIVSFVAEGIAVVLALLVYRVAATQWSIDEFGEYAIARKVVSAILVIALLGSDLAVVRFVAFEAGGRPALGARYVTGALAVAAVATAVLAVVLVALAGPIGVVVFGEAGHDDVVMAFAWTALGGTLYGIAYGTARGRLRLGRAAALLVVSTGLAPLVAVILSPGSVAVALTIMGIAWAGAALAMLAIDPSMLRGRPLVGPIVRYGPPRAAGLILQMTYLAAPAVVAAHRFGIAEAGNVAFALLVLGLISTMLTPIGVVLMPRSADLARKGETAALARHVRRLLTAAVPAVVAAVVALQLFADALLGAFLGPAYASASGAVRAIAWAAVPWTFFVALRGLLDARDLRPLNARNVLAATLVYAVLETIAAGTGAAEEASYYAFVVSAVVLGGLTLVEARSAVARPALPQPVVEEPLQP